MWRSIASALCGVLFLTIAFAPVASAQPTETLETLSTTLPWTAAGLAAVWTGFEVYLIGGLRDGIRSDAITRFNPATGAFVDESVRLPGIRYSASALWTGTEILVFGGATGTGDWNDTVRFNPSTKVLRYGMNMTSSRSHAPSVWTGQYVYILGGTWGADGVRRDILRYDPVADRMTVVPSVLVPGFPRLASGTWDGTRAVVFGTADAPTFTFDPATETVANVSVSGPMPRVVSGSAVQMGPYAYAFGGWDPSGGRYTSGVLRFRTGSAEWGLAPANLSRPQGLTAAVVAGDRAYIFGGWNGVSDANTIQVFRSTEGPSLLVWIGLAATLIAIVAIVLVVWSRRRKKAGKTAETPPEDR